MSHSSSRSRFEELQKETIKTIKRIYQKAQNKLWLPSYWEHIFTRTMALFAIGGFVVYLLFVTWNMFPNAIERQFGETWLTGRIGNIAFVIVASVLYLIVLIPVIVIIDNMSHISKPLFRFVYFALLLPLTFLISLDLVACYLNGCKSIVFSVGSLLAWCLVINIICFVLVAFCIYIVTQLPYWFFFVLTKPIYTERKAFLPTYDGIAVECVNMLLCNIKDWNEDVVSEVIEQARQKYTGLGAQAQTLSPAIGAFSLFGLFALLFTQQELRDFFLFVEGNLGPEFTNVLVGVVVLIVIVLFFLSIQYFIRIVIAMRVLDVIICLLEKRLRQVRTIEVSSKEDYILSNGLYLPKSLQNRNEVEH